MYAIEFQATVKNGVIEIPPEHRGGFHNPVRVIVLSDKPTTATNDLIARLLANPLRVNGFHPFTREEVYACR